jgi:PAS domain S-box-containing protein
MSSQPLLNRVVVRTSGAILVATGMLVLLGWWLDIGLLKSLRPDLASMKANTALALVLAGLAVAQVHRTRWPEAVWPTVVLGTLVALLGGLTLVEYTLGVDLGIDEILTRDRGSVYTSSPGRMAPVAALSFLTMGAALVLASRQSRPARWGAQALTLLVMTLCFVNMVSYVYGAGDPFGLARHVHVAFHTLVAFLILCTGLLATNPEVGLWRLLASETVGGVLARRMLPACVVVPIALGAIRLWAERAGYYHTEVGLALYATSNVVVLASLMAWTASVATSQHAGRLVAEAALLSAHAELERRANDSEQQFRQLVEAMPDNVSVIRDQRFVYVNPAAVKLMGYDHADQIVGMSVLKIAGEADHDGMNAEAAQLTAGRSSLLPAVRAGRRRDGSEFFYEYISLPMDFEGQPAILAISKDVTDRRKAEAALQEANSLWRAMLDSADYTIIAMTPSGIIRDFNATAERLLGYPAAEVVGKTTPTIFHDPAEVVARAQVLSRELGEELEPGFEVLVTRAWRGTADENEWTYVRKDGGRFPVRLSVTAMRDRDGAVTGFLAIGMDITEQRRAREELVRAKEAAEHAMRARSDFLARMSHEIRTPMNGVLGMTALILDTALSRQQREYMETARSSARSLLGIIEDILDFSKIDAGKLHLEQISFPVHTCCGESMRSLAGQAHRKGLQLLVDIAADVPPYLIGDPHRLRQVITNLVSNAVKFTDRGEVALRVRVTEHRAGEVTLEIVVSDTGIGIPQDHQTAIFEAFSQADEATTRRFGGTGLGLAICSQLVSLMGGTLWVKSEIGRGSHFGLAIPLAIDPSVRPEPAPPADLAGLQVLVVDDHPSQCEIIVHLLSSWRMRAVSANSDGALKVAREARALGAPFQLLILDGALSADDSHQLASRLKAECADDAPVIVLGRLGVGEAAQPDSDLGRHVVVMKPVAPSNLLETVQAVLSGTSVSGTSWPVASAIRTASRPLRVLIAEDNQVNVLVALAILKKMGHQVVAVENGRQALTALAQGQFDLVLMDVQMPEMNGLDATRTIRASESGTGHVPIIALTAQARKGDREVCLAAGMDAFVSKPLDVDELFAAIEAVTAAHPVAEPAPPEAAGLQAFDDGGLLRRVGNDGDLFRSVVEMFRATLPRLVEGLGVAVASGENESIGRAAHLLKGSLLNVGARPAAGVAQVIEDQARHGQTAGAAQEMSLLRAELIRLDVALLAPRQQTGGQRG